jgi:hypothetical protein
MEQATGLPIVSDDRRSKPRLDAPEYGALATSRQLQPRSRKITNNTGIGTPIAHSRMYPSLPSCLARQL